MPARRSAARRAGTYIAFENDVALFARQLKQLGLAIPWVGSASVASTTARNLAGPALDGVYSVTDYNAAVGPRAKKYFDDFSKAYGKAPDTSSSWAYDSVLLTAEAISKAGGTEPGKIQAALRSLRNFEGTEGTYNFDDNGDGLRGYSVVRNDNGEEVFVKHIEFEK
jgi:branched-chain amino acid transport system substrate-binding protein